MIRFSLRRPSSVRFLAQVFALLGFSLAAGAVDLGFKVDPGVAFPLTQQQSQRFGVGGGASAKLLLGLTPYLDVTGGISLLALPTSSNSLSSGSGIAWGYGPGLRLRGSRDSEAFRGASPWIDADALYVRTGDLNRFGFAVGVGLAFPLGEQRNLWLGPFVRYQQIVGSGGSGVDSRDAKVLFAGLSFVFGAGRARPAPALPPSGRMSRHRPPSRSRRRRRPRQVRSLPRRVRPHRKPGVPPLRKGRRS
jgi:hypothetical protein